MSRGPLARYNGAIQVQHAAPGLDRSRDRDERSQTLLKDKSVSQLGIFLERPEQNTARYTVVLLEAS